MQSWKLDRILKVLVAWVTFLFVFSWLPLVRVVIEGDTYQWGTTHFGVSFSAKGLEADMWLLVFKSALFGMLIYTASRGVHGLFRWLVVPASVVMTADVMHAAVTDPDGFEFRGDTLGIHLQLGPVVVAVVAALSLLAVYWVIREATSDTGPVLMLLSLRNKRLLTLWFSLLPLQFVLLRFGEPDGLTDQIGVLITVGPPPPPPPPRKKS